MAKRSQGTPLHTPLPLHSPSHFSYTLRYTLLSFYDPILPFSATSTSSPPFPSPTSSPFSHLYLIPSSPIYLLLPSSHFDLLLFRSCTSQSCLSISTFTPLPPSSSLSIHPHLQNTNNRSANIRKGFFPQGRTMTWQFYI